MLRKTRIVLAALFFVGITLLFLGIGVHWWGWMAKLQFLPACMAINVAVIAAVLLVTFLLGRVYCSVICPLGVFQDLVIALRRRFDKVFARRRAVRRQKPWPVKKFAFGKERKWLRYGVLALTVAAFLAGVQGAVALIAPYSAYGRMVRSIIGIGDGAPAALILTGIVSYILIIALSACWGRTWCNNVCPVGTILGTVSRFSIFRPYIDESKCVGCLSCGKKCKAGCIDMEHHTIDTSRCVDCFDCIGNCKEGAIRFGRPKRKAADETAPAGNDKASMSRREFLATTAALAVGTAVASAKEHLKVDGGLAPVASKQNPGRKGLLVPPGAGSAANFYSRCTACQLCVASCPNHVLRPSTDLEHLLQPRMGYEEGFCRPECTECSHVCPSGAISPVDADRKTLIHIGHARVDRQTCIGCGKCASVCPVGAVKMYRSDDGKKLAAVAAEQCIGCGKCEFLCPVRPVSAIVVDALDNHYE